MQRNLDKWKMRQRGGGGGLPDNYHTNIQVVKTY